MHVNGTMRTPRQQENSWLEGRMPRADHTTTANTQPFASLQQQLLHVADLCSAHIPLLHKVQQQLVELLWLLQVQPMVGALEHHAAAVGGDALDVQAALNWEHTAAQHGMARGRGHPCQVQTKAQ